MRLSDTCERRSFRHGRMCVFVFLSSMTCCCWGNSLFVPGKEYTYAYEATSSTGVLIPSKAASAWAFCGTVVVQAKPHSTYIQLRSLKMRMWNGQLDEKGEKNTDVNVEAEELLKPFNVTYDMGLIQNFSVEADTAWASNIKRSIAGILQLDLASLQSHVAFHTIEVNHYGQCNVDYIVTPEENNEKVIRKSVDPRTCLGHPQRTFSNIPSMQCPNNDQNPVMKSSDRLYRITSSNSNETTINFVNATGSIYLQPFQSLGEMQFSFTRQQFRLLSVEDIKKDITMRNTVHKNIKHELPVHDLTQGRGTPDKNTVFRSIGHMLDRLSRRLENPGLDTEVDNLHNTTISTLLYYLNMLNQADLQKAYNNISGTSYKEETVRNMFLETLPQVGSTESALFVLHLILQKKVSDITAVQLLTHLPFHIRNPDIPLLVSMQKLLNLPDSFSSEIHNTAILTYGTLIYKTCQLYCPYEMLDDYVRLYLDKYTESKVYEKKMVWLAGLANIQLGRVVEFLEPVASGKNAESRHLRALAAWSSLPTAALRPDVIYPVYWPILANRSEHLEMRITAMTLLVISNPLSSRLISLFWYMKSEPCPHLYNFFYTTLKSMERTNYPCYSHIGGLASQFTRMLRKPTGHQHALTGNYLFDYQDTHRHFGAMLHGIVIANPITNIPETIYVKLNNHGNGRHLNHISLYVKAEGLLHSLSTYVEHPTQVGDILKRFKIDQKHTNPVHVEIIARVQEKTVLCLHLNQTNLIKAFKFVASLQESIYYTYHNMEFHLNEQRVHVPVTMESVQVTDLGTNVRLAVTITSLFSLRGNFTHIPNGRNNHVIWRTSIHGVETIESYNPLMDLWHAAERAQSLHAYMPINITFGFQDKFFVSYITPGENLRTGITAHARTATNIRGSRVKSKLKALCANCPILYTVKQHPDNEMKTEILFQSNVPELGGQLYLKLFNCEGTMSSSDIIMDVLYSHRSNHQTWPIVQAGLTALHFMDYFTYSPPPGSCGVTAFLESNNSRPSEVKFEYAVNGKVHMFSLTHKDSESLDILQQWNVAFVYEVTNWITDTLKLKATRTAPNEKVTKICIEVERNMPWEWDFLRAVPSQSSSLKLNIAWGLADTAKGKCIGSSIMLNSIAEVSKDQIEESEKDKWPYEDCRKQSKGKMLVPYSDACYEASKELSTLRKYEAFIRLDNVPEKLSKLITKLQVLYDFGNLDDKTLLETNQFLVSAVLPKDSETAEVQINRHKTSIKLNANIIDYLLIKTRLHKYMDDSMFRSFFDTCILTPKFARSSNNITMRIKMEEEVLVLGHCYDENPRFAISAIASPKGITLTFNDESDNLKIVPHLTGGIVYNHTEELPLERNFLFTILSSKRIRLDENTVDLLLTDVLLFTHWTQGYVLLFYPSFVREYACGICTATMESDELYRKITID